MAALTMLDWCLLQSTAAKPSVVEMLSSFVWQPMSGIIQSRRDNQAVQQTSSSMEEMQHEDPGRKQEQFAVQQQQQQLQRTPSKVQMLVENLNAMVRLMVVMDVMSSILGCMLCYGDFEACNWQSSSLLCTSVPQIASAVHNAACYLTPLFSALASAVPSVLAPMLFELCTTVMAGFLLGVQLEFTYMCGRLVLIILGYPKIGPPFMFDKPWSALSLSELWSKRWHQVLRYYFTGLGYNLADKLTAAVVTGLSWLLPGSSIVMVIKQQQQQQQQGQSPALSSALQKQLKRAMRTLVVFAISGLVHEYVSWAAFGIWTWHQLAFFMFHAFAILFEDLGSKLMTCSGRTSASVPMWLRRVWVLGFAAWTAPWFVNVYLHNQHYQNYVPPFLIPLATELLKHFGLCLCEA
jgi:hypothetical protein